MQTGEPVFEVYRVADHEELTSPAGLCDSFKPEMHDAHKSFEGWDALSEFLDEQEDESEFAWVEVGRALAPVHQLCSVEGCDETAQTASPERLQHLRTIHQVSTGH